MTMPGPPSITPENASPDTLELYSYLPQFLQDTDAENHYTFLSWLEGIGSQQQIIDDLCRDTPEAIGWSTIFNVGTCPTYALPWLAQCVGVRFPGTLTSDALQRQAILAQAGMKRGTVAAIQAAILPYLGSNGSVQIIERYPDPYSLTIVYGDNDGSLTYSELAVQKPLYAEIPETNVPVGTPGYPNYNDFPVQTGASVAAVALAAVPAGLIATVIDAD